ncbi:helix-turn-helix transcriptional regulator [Leucobacter triazinivorans]|uniref:helix-turn-helix transcriptional regulator n=1 Tax=Leucobacter triazinivorans TaxID=1784719 RepID=UPI0013EEDC17|nr:AraC family transcriptional regulator [Leucobacter triazinivorans]
MFDRAKLVSVMDGAAEVETALGAVSVRQGHSFAVGAGVWCSVLPRGPVRLWTVYVDETLFRSHMRWVLPVQGRVVPQVHPAQWRGAPIVVDAGADVLRRTERFWRQMSVLASSNHPPELVAARTLTLFSHAVEQSVQALVVPDQREVAYDTPPVSPVGGRLTVRTSVGTAARAAQLLLSGISEHWDMRRLSQSVAMSRPHLTRLFTDQFGTTPMRFLTETRTTEFTRLLEETELPIGVISRRVGWNDARVAAAWFRRRFGISPSQFRRSPHPHVEGGTAA